MGLDPGAGMFDLLEEQERYPRNREEGTQLEGKTSRCDAM